MKQFNHYLNIVKNRVNESVEAPTKLRSVTVEYSDGTTINTSMASHLSDEDIKNYYKIGKQFNLGNAKIDGDGNYGDNLQTVKNVIINEAAMNKDDLFNILKKYTLYLYDNGHVNGNVMKTGVSIINKFMGVGESLNTDGHYNIMVVQIPPVEKWYTAQLSSIIGDTCQAFDFMGKKYCIRDKDLEMFKNNVGMSIKFKYDNNLGNKYMEFATLTESVVNESQCYYCDNCGERAEHEEIEENHSMTCSNCGSSEWVPENEYDSRD